MGKPQFIHHPPQLMHETVYRRPFIQLFYSVKQKKMYNSYKNLTLGTSRGIEMVDSNVLVRVEAISNYSKLFFANGKSLVVAKLLSYFEEQLSDTHFVRLHRSHLVNIRYIRSYDRSQSAEVTLVNNEILTVAKRKRTEFRRALSHYNSLTAQA
jgi:two-component system, LytTR family, response regulator